ncbi:MAG: lysophospholipid acyltransferase family protein [Thermoanaerobacteraceae bacterium]
MIYYIVRNFSKIFFKLFYSFKVEILSKIPENSCIFVANHQSLLDPPVVAASLKRRLIFLASTDLYKIPIIRFILIKTNSIPIKKNTADIEAIKTALKKLKEGYSIAMFPEGGLSKDGEIKKAYEGAMYISYKSSIPIVPISIKGTHDIMPFGKFIPRLKGKISVKIGQPIYPDLDIEIRKGIENMRDKVMNSIKEMYEL